MYYMQVLIEIDKNNNSINFAPKTVAEEVVQNIRNIFSQAKYQIPYQRNMGFDEDIIDQTAGRAVMMFQIDMIKQVKQYEPRAIIKSFKWQDGNLVNGDLRVKILVYIDEVYL